MLPAIKLASALSSFLRRRFAKGHHLNRSVADQERGPISLRGFAALGTVARQESLQFGGVPSRQGGRPNALEVAQRPDDAAGAVVQGRLETIRVVPILLDRGDGGTNIGLR